MRYLLLARLETNRLIIALATYKINQMDVISAFSSCYIQEKVCLKQFVGYVVKGNEDKGLKLKRMLYGFNKHRGHGIVELMNILRKNLQSAPMIMPYTSRRTRMENASCLLVCR